MVCEVEGDVVLVGTAVVALFQVNCLFSNEHMFGMFLMMMNELRIKMPEFLEITEGKIPRIRLKFSHKAVKMLTRDWSYSFHFVVYVQPGLREKLVAASSTRFETRYKSYNLIIYSLHKAIVVLFCQITMSFTPKMHGYCTYIVNRSTGITLRQKCNDFHAVKAGMLLRFA